MKNLHATINKRLTLICTLSSLFSVLIMGITFYIVYIAKTKAGEKKPEILELFVYSIPAILVAFTIVFLIAYFVTRKLTKSVVEPVIDMAEHMEDIENHVSYEELLPFARKIKSHDAMRQEFTANVSHELKTPLTSIYGYAQLMEAGVVEKEKQKEFAGKIVKESERLLSLINDIIKLTQLDETGLTNMLESELKIINLYDIVEECITRLTSIAEKKKVKLSLIANPDESFAVKGDEGLLTELAYNLIDNAIRYNKEGGEVYISLTKEYTGVVKILKNRFENAYVVLSVKDTGIGIDEEYQPHVFERFFRVDKSHSRASGGTGLGLSIVKHIAGIHKATIDLESTLGVGTEIEVHFPEWSKEIND